MNKIILLTIPVFILGGVLFFIPINNENKQGNVKGISEINGEKVQEIEILAKGGYFPQEIIAKAEIKSLLKIETQNTYDCSSAISIPKIKYREILEANGIKVLEIDPQPKGSQIEGTCQMGMYGFVIKFE